jgi:hypothetical protein
LRILVKAKRKGVCSSREGYLLANDYFLFPLIVCNSNRIDIYTTEIIDAADIQQVRGGPASALQGSYLEKERWQGTEKWLALQHLLGEGIPAGN